MKRSWFETLFDPFPEAPVERPPDRLFAFYRYFIKPVRWLVLAVLLISLASTVTEMALFVFLGWIVDWATTTSARHVLHHLWLAAGGYGLRCPYSAPADRAGCCAASTISRWCRV